MSHEVYSFIVIKYPGQETAEQALATARTLAKEKAVTLKDAVAITKTGKGKIKLQQTKDDTAGRGFLKGGLIGILFGLLFGGAGWVIAGALAGTGLAIFDRGIKNKLLVELGEKMTQEESALAILIQEADWGTLMARLDAAYTGQVVVNALVDDKLESLEQLTDDQKTLDAVPQEVDLAGASQEDAPEPALPA